MSDIQINSSVQRRIAALLKGSGKTLSAAESCTGGMISHLITTVSGSSEYYLGSVTSYAISVKEKLLGVPAELIAENGVVSAEVAAAMAEGVRKAVSSDFSVATTGLAEGSDEHYPEGTVWMAVSGPEGTRTMLFQTHSSDRCGNIEAFANAALSFLEAYLNDCLV